MIQQIWKVLPEDVKLNVEGFLQSLLDSDEQMNASFTNPTTIPSQMKPIEIASTVEPVAVEDATVQTLPVPVQNNECQTVQVEFVDNQSQTQDLHQLKGCLICHSDDPNRLDLLTGLTTRLGFQLKSGMELYICLDCVKGIHLEIPSSSSNVSLNNNPEIVHSSKNTPPKEILAESKVNLGTPRIKRPYQPFDVESIKESIRNSPVAIKRFKNLIE